MLAVLDLIGWDSGIKFLEQSQTTVEHAQPDPTSVPMVNWKLLWPMHNKIILTYCNVKLVDLNEMQVQEGFFSLIFPHCRSLKKSNCLCLLLFMGKCKYSSESFNCLLLIVFLCANNSFNSGWILLMERNCQWNQMNINILI